MFDMMGMMKKAQDMQKKMQEAQAELAFELVEGTAGQGAVTITLTATGEMKSIHIAANAMDDKDTLEDLIVLAFEDARARAAALTASRMEKITAGLPLPPGMKLF